MPAADKTPPTFEALEAELAELHAAAYEGEPYDPARMREVWWSLSERHEAEGSLGSYMLLLFSARYFQHTLDT